MGSIFDMPKSDIITGSSYQSLSFYRTPKRSRSGENEISETSPGLHKGLPGILGKRGRIALQPQLDYFMQSQSQPSQSMSSQSQLSQPPVSQTHSQSSQPQRRSSHPSQSQSKRSTPEQLTEMNSFEPVAAAEEEKVLEQVISQAYIIR